MSNPEARELQFSRDNLSNGLADVFANRLADICNGVIVKLRQGLSIFEHLYIVQRGRSIAGEILNSLVKPSDEVLSGVRVRCHHPRQGRGLSHQMGIVPLPLLEKNQMGWMN
jgi:hypothetical protein